MATSKHKHPSVTIHLPQELLDLVKQLQDKEDTTRTKVIEEALWFYLTNRPAS